MVEYIDMLIQTMNVGLADVSIQESHPPLTRLFEVFPCTLEYHLERQKPCPYKESHLYVIDVHLEHARAATTDELLPYFELFNKLCDLEPELMIHYHGKYQIPDSLKLGNLFKPVILLN